MVITLLPLFHKNQHVISISFEFNLTVKNYISSIEGVNWSKTHKTFYIENTFSNKQMLYNILRRKNWYVNYSAITSQKNKTQKIKGEIPNIKLPTLLEVKQKELEKFKKWMLQKRLSTNTVNTYFEVTSFFLRYAQLKQKPITVRLVEQFNYDFIVKPNKSISYQNQCINGIKKYLDYIEVSLSNFTIERPKKPKKLPEVLSDIEVKNVLDSITNLKHKTLLSLIYSAGLRIGEALQLRVTDIDSKRMLIHIKSGKGKKDRYTLLSPKFLELLPYITKLINQKIIYLRDNLGIYIVHQVLRTF